MSVFHGGFFSRQLFAFTADIVVGQRGVVLPNRKTGMDQWLIVGVVVLFCIAMIALCVTCLCVAYKKRKRHTVYPRSSPLLEPSRKTAVSSDIESTLTLSDSGSDISMSPILGNLSRNSSTTRPQPLSDFQFLPSDKTLDDARIARHNSAQVPRLQLENLKPKASKSTLF